MPRSPFLYRKRPRQCLDSAVICWCGEAQDHASRLRPKPMHRKIGVGWEVMMSRFGHGRPRGKFSLI